MIKQTQKNGPTEIADRDLDGVQGGAETVHLYLEANGTVIEGADTASPIQTNGLRSDGELVQANKRGTGVLKK